MNTHFPQPTYEVQMRCNPDEYREDLAVFNMTREQEDKLLYSLWEMMRIFCEMGHGVSAINKLFPELFDKTYCDSGNMLEEYVKVSKPH